MKPVSLISVIIICKSDPALAATLTTLGGLNSPVPYEVIVVDASPPGAIAKLERSNPWVKWDHYPFTSQRTTPQQRNRGLELANGEVIAFIDSNCIPGDDWFTALVDSLSTGENIVCGPVRDSSQTNLVHYAPELETGRHVDICTTISVGIRREVFETVGGFDNTFAYGQDIDFFWRATDKGYRIYYNPDFSITHDWGKQSEQFARAYRYGKARAHLFKKHWRLHKGDLAKEAHVWTYALFIIGLPVTVVFPWYPLLLLLPMLKNWRQNPLGLVAHHLAYGIGVLVGAATFWPRSSHLEFTSAAKSV